MLRPDVSALEISCHKHALIFLFNFFFFVFLECKRPLSQLQILSEIFLVWNHNEKFYVVRFVNRFIFSVVFDFVFHLFLTMQVFQNLNCFVLLRIVVCIFFRFARISMEFYWLKIVQTKYFEARHYVLWIKYTIKFFTHQLFLTHTNGFCCSFLLGYMFTSFIAIFLSLQL